MTNNNELRQGPPPKTPTAKWLPIGLIAHFVVTRYAG